MKNVILALTSLIGIQAQAGLSQMTCSMDKLAVKAYYTTAGNAIVQITDITSGLNVEEFAATTSQTVGSLKTSTQFLPSVSVTTDLVIHATINMKKFCGRGGCEFETYSASLGYKGQNYEFLSCTPTNVP